VSGAAPLGVREALRYHQEQADLHLFSAVQHRS
jgi:hypothetical protein